MEPKHIVEQAQDIMSGAVLPEATKSSLQQALCDAATRGFLIDLQQLQANLSRLELESRH